MIHTADLTCRIEGEIYRNFINYPNKVWNSEEERYYITVMSEHGILLTGKRIKKLDYGAYHLNIRLNLSKLMYNDEHIQLVDEKLLEQVEETFNAFMDTLDIGLPHLKDWKLRRCDYCLNLETENVEEYIRKLQKSIIPHTHRLDYNQHRNYVHKAGSLYLPSKTRKKANRSTTINFYDKHHEMLKPENQGKFTEEHLHAGENILRLEVQCHRVKLNSMLKSGKYDIRELNLVEFMKPELTYQVIKWYLDRTVKDATFQRKSIAEQMINELNCSAVRKNLLIGIVRSIASQNQSISKAKNRYIENGTLTAEQFDYCINYLTSKDINPVTISDNIKLKNKTGKEGLESIHKLFEKAYKQCLK